jgi:trigger factor
MKTQIEELPESKVRLAVEVPEADVQHAYEHAASDLAGSIRVPGFRKGHVPAQVVMARVGRAAVWEEAVRSHIDTWFWNAATDSGIRPISTPEVEYDGLPGDNDTFHFTATVAVLPEPELGDWTTLEVPVAEPEVPEELVAEELEELRTSVAELVPVTDRPVIEGDTVVLDLLGDETGTQRDYVAEVGDGRLIEPIEAALPGMKPGESKTVQLQVDEEQTTDVEVTVKEVKEKALPELDDDLARAASEFETLDELRGDLEARLREQLEEELDARFRENAVDALVDVSDVGPIEPLVERRSAELLTGLVRSLEQRGISFQTYLAMTGQPQDAVVARLREQAAQAVKRELVLDAVAKRLGTEVSDEEVDELIRAQAVEVGEEPERIGTVMRESGGFEQLRADLRLKKALDEVVSQVRRIPVELAQAREKLWTPEKEKAGAGMKIWTPGSEEAERT